MLHIEDLPERVRTLILQKAEGNPFFVEEVIRSLLDAKLVVRDNSHWRATREIENIAVPDTLAAVIAARLDRLDDSAKRTAQTASVVGRAFTARTSRSLSRRWQTRWRRRGSPGESRSKSDAESTVIARINSEKHF